VIENTIGGENEAEILSMFLWRLAHLLPKQTSKVSWAHCGTSSKIVDG
jgi:hypothetical protein